MNLLILGANGFIGSNLIAHIVKHKPWHLAYSTDNCVHCGLPKYAEKDANMK